MRNLSEKGTLTIFEVNGKKSVHSGINAEILNTMFQNDESWLRSVKIKKHEVICGQHTVVFFEVVPETDLGVH